MNDVLCRFLRILVTKFFEPIRPRCDCWNRISPGRFYRNFENFRFQTILLKTIFSESSVTKEILKNKTLLRWPVMIAKSGRRRFPTLFSAEGSQNTIQFPSLFYGFPLYYPVSNIILRIQQHEKVVTDYSTVTLFARLRGLSTSQPRATAM
jgi:hypothetical protein